MSNNNLAVLKLFVDNKDTSFTIRKAAQTLNINYKIVYQEIIKLEQEHLLKIVKHGNAKVCSFNYQYHSKIVEIEDMRKQEIFKNKDIKLIYHRIKTIKSPFYCLILFGSYAKKTNKKGSDIDICLITDNEKTTSQVQSMLSITSLNIDLQEFTSEQFLAMLTSKEFNVGNEIMKHSIILYGIESFYEMIHHVKQ